MRARRKKSVPPSPSLAPATWQELDAAARAPVIERLTSDAVVREQLAKEHPEEAEIYLRAAAPFRAALAALLLLVAALSLLCSSCFFGDDVETCRRACKRWCGWGRPECRVECFAERCGGGEADREDPPVDGADDY